MGGRGTFAADSPVPYCYEVDTKFSPDGKWEGVKILKAIEGGNHHGLPESSHTSNAYIKLKADGTFHEMRLYDNAHVLYLEIGYHPEETLTGNRTENVLHFHRYDSRFSKNKTGPFIREKAQRLTPEMIRTYGKYFKGVKL